MKRYYFWAFVLCGFANSALSGLALFSNIDYGWDRHNVVLMCTTFVTAVILIRAPFSVKNIDIGAVSILRYICAFFLGYFQYGMVEVAYYEGFDFLLLAVSTVNLGTLYLLVFMKRLRKVAFTRVQTC